MSNVILAKFKSSPLATHARSCYNRKGLISKRGDGQRMKFDKHIDRRLVVSGIVIAGVGNGNLSSAWKRKVEELKGKITIVRCSRANGFVNHNGSQDDEALGTIAGGALSGQKARILLMFALADQLPLAEIRRVFKEY